MLKSFKSIRIPRFIFNCVNEDLVSLQLHGFCDSSKATYCAAVFVRKETNVGVTVNLLTAKSKVAPLNALSIPRFELLACLLLSVTHALQPTTFDETRCWSDSEVALYWIKGVAKEWKPWVENRVMKTRKIVQPDRWRHVPGKSNPADIPTRNITNKDLEVTSTWFKGPQLFLYHAKECWPIDEINELDENKLNDDSPLMEIKSTYRKSIVMHQRIATNYLNLIQIINIENFSNLHRLLCVRVRFKI